MRKLARAAKGTPPPSRVDEREHALHAQKLEAVGAFACGITHDFSNVLQVVMGIADLVAMGEVPPERLPDMMQRIGNAARHGSDLVQQLMAFARDQATVPRPIDLGEAITDTARMLERLLPRSIRTQVTLTNTACTVLADPGQIQQVLINLATNARDAMPRGGTLSITSQMIEHPTRRLVRITVSDTGSGMTEAVRTRVFEPFFTTKQIGRGTGLGLATIATIVRQLEGRIDVESTLGVGTTFTIEVPCTACKRTTTVTATDNALDATVLVIEPDANVRREIRNHLIAAGADVLEAAHLDDAIALLGAADAIICDAPTASGLRDLFHDLPVLVSEWARGEALLRPRDRLVAIVGELIARSRAPAGPPARLIPPAPRSGSSGRRP